jgi:hypothetical protein
MKKKNTPLKKKNNSLKLFYKLAKRAYLVSKKRKLGWRWSDAQKWTSKNLFQAYKGTKNLSKIKVTEIDKQVADILDGNLPIPPAPIITLPQPIDDCYSPFEVASYLLDDFEWFDINEKVSILNEDLQVDLDLEFENNVFAKTGVIKKSFLPDLVKVREDMRKVSNGSGYFEPISFYIVLIEGREDNQDIACNYYVLITFKGSFSYNLVNNKGLIRKAFVPKEKMPKDERERIENAERQKEEDRKKSTRDKSRNFKLPKKLEPIEEPIEEPKIEPAKEPTTKKISKEELRTIRWQEFNKAKESYRRDLDEGIINKKEYKDIILKLESKLEKGGEI